MQTLISVREDQGNAVSTKLSEQKFKNVRKRDGRTAPFDISKIQAAILKAGRATGEFGEDTATQLSRRVLGMLHTLMVSDTPAVEDIQDVVEDVLLAGPFKKTAKAYILYRDQHARIREFVQKAKVDLMDDYLAQLDWRVQENSNMTYSLQGLNNYISSESAKAYWLNRFIPPISVRRI